MTEYVIRFFLDDDTIVEYRLRAKSIYAAEDIAVKKYHEFYNKRIVYITSDVA